jgi:predicted metal-dependent phosphoesterase TrpH
MFMKVELHCHSIHSDGTGSAKEIMNACQKTLGAVAITDHNSMSGYLEARKIHSNTILIPAVEITCRFGKRKGHVLALGVQEFFKGDVFEVLDFIRESGGVSIIAHPFRGLGYSFHEKEIWKKADAIEVLNGNTLAFKNHKAYSQAVQMKKSMTSGSDAHFAKFVGKYACEIDADDIDEILAAIRKGNIKIPQGSTNAFSILYYGTLRGAKKNLRKIAGQKL